MGEGKLFKFRRDVIPILIVLVTISSVSQWSDLPIKNTVFWWSIYGALLFSFVKLKKRLFDPKDSRNLLFMHLYLAWNIVCIIRGIFVAEDYWEWRNLVGSGMVLLLPLSLYIFTNPNMVQRVIAIWLKIALPAFILILPFLHGEALGRYLIPISFLLLFFSKLSIKWKIVSLICALTVLLGDLTARSNIIKFIVPMLFSTVYIFERFLSKKILEICRLFLMFIPFVLFYLAISGTFNVFKLNEYLGEDYTTTTVADGEVKESDLTDDTRTFLYIEVLQSAIKHDYMFLGRSPARGNESAFWYEFSHAYLEVTQKERFANEVSILNVLTWTGLLGVGLYFLLFFYASFLAVNRSKSVFLKIVGLYIAFRWVYAWVEDFSLFDLSYIFLWMMIGMCLSNSFRNMTDSQFIYWLKGIFNSNYRKNIVNVPGQLKQFIIVRK